MTTYAISYARGVKKDFKAIDKKEYVRIVAVIHKLATNPRPEGAKKLVGLKYYRIRVGDYRVIYDVRDSELVILVVEVGHRREIYR